MATAQPGRLLNLTDDILVLVLRNLRATSLVACTRTCADLRRLSGAAAERRYRALRTIPAELSEHWMMALAAFDRIEDHVGPRPDRSWKDEWLAVMEEHMKINGQRKIATSIREDSATRDHFAADAMLTRNNLGSMFDLHLLWALAPIAQATQERSPRYAALTHEASDVVAVSCAQNFGRAPLLPCMGYLRGTCGLATEDSSWAPLLAADGSMHAPAPGLELLTHGVSMAACMAREMRQKLAKQSHVMREVEEHLEEFQPDEEVELPPSGGPGDFGNDLVCFHSRPTDHSGRHGLIRLDSIRSEAHRSKLDLDCALPPLSTVMVDSIESVHGKRIFHVSVCY